MGILDDDVVRVREQTDLVAVISQYTQLKKSGKSWSGLCPFHAEKSPSFSVDPGKGLYHCFGCSASGDAITFMREIEQLDFVAAVETLATKSGVTLRYTDKGGGEQRKKKDRLLSHMEKAVDWYHDRLKTGADAKEARAYLRSRGFDSAEVERYRIGWAPDGWDELASALKLSKEDLEGTGLGMLNRRNRLQDFFRARVLFPIFDDRGRPIGFGGRKLPGADGAKYQNSRDNTLYHKSQALYGLNWAKADAVNAGEMVICEGYTDVIGFNRAGVDRAIATCGTALTEDHVKMLSRFTRRLVLAYDADEAGQAAAERVYEWEAAHDVGFWVVDLPAGTDPDELAQKDPDTLRSAVENARPFLEFRVHRVLGAADLDSAEGRAKAANAALDVISEHNDPLVVDQYLMEVAQRCRIDVDQLRQQLSTVRRSGSGGRSGSSNSQQGGSRSDRTRNSNGAPLPRDPQGGQTAGGASARDNRGQNSGQQDGHVSDGAPVPTESGDSGDSGGHDEAPGSAFAPIRDGAEREALRLIVSEPEFAEVLEPTLFSAQSARAAFEALRNTESLTAAIDSADPIIATELRKLSVEDLEVDALSALSRLATEAARQELVELEHDARGSSDPLEYSESIGYLKRTLDHLRGSQFEMDPVVELLHWLNLRRDET